MSVWNISGTQLDELLCSSGLDANSHDPNLKSQSILDDPWQEAKKGVIAVAQGDVIPVETQSPPQQTDASAQKALPIEDPTSRNGQEAEHWSDHSASGQTPAPSQTVSDQNEMHSGKQQVGCSIEASERKQANNREHQRRWRLRQKARTIAELHYWHRVAA